MDQETLLRALPLFEHLDDDEMAALEARLERRTFDAGVEVFRAGDEGSTLFLIQDGAVEITTGDAKQRTTLASLFAGHFFGELSLLDGSPRSATATTTKPCVLQALDRDDFQAFLTSKPQAATKILAEMASRLRQTNALFSQQVSRDVLEEEEESLSMGQRVADVVAAFGGSWTFIFAFGAIMTVWMTANGLAGAEKAFDPFPFILLNLALSTCAALQAPVIMMSQNRQATKDKLLAQNDYLVNLKAELGIQQMLKGQSEILARLQILENRTNRPS
jgi:CRP/FNR family transcriptional regulator, cyclic AMP receptor protein